MNYNYSLPPQNLGNLDPEKRVEFVRASGKTSSKAILDSDDVPEASTADTPSTSDAGFATIYQEIIDKTSTEKAKKPKIEEVVDEDDDIIVLEDVIKSEPGTSSSHQNLDIRDVNGFLKAAKDGDLEGIRKFLKKKIPIDITDFYGWTATMCAAAEGNFEVCKYLLENGADPGVRDKNGMGILQVAQKNRQKEFVKRLFAYFCKSETSSTSSEPEQLSFCELCNTFIAESEITKHISSITHQLNDNKTLGAAPQSGIQIGPSNIGYRLMCASGWTEDQGLGRNSDGQRFPIKTILKRNKTGLGMENPPKKVTHFGPYDKNAIRTEKKIQKPMTKKDLELKMRKDQRIAKKLRADFGDSDNVYDYFNGKS